MGSTDDEEMKTVDRMTWEERITFWLICLGAGMALGLIIAAVAKADPALSIQTTTNGAITTHSGAVVPVTVRLSNNRTPRPPLVVTASISWVDEAGATQTATDSVSVAVVQPITVNGYRAALNSGQYVTGSALLNGLPVTPTIGLGTLTVPMAWTLNEGEAVTVGYSVKVD